MVILFDEMILSRVGLTRLNTGFSVPFASLAKGGRPAGRPYTSEQC